MGLRLIGDCGEIVNQWSELCVIHPEPEPAEGEKTLLHPKECPRAHPPETECMCVKGFCGCSSPAEGPPWRVPCTLYPVTCSLAMSSMHLNLPGAPSRGTQSFK